MNPTEARGTSEMAALGSVVLDSSGVKAMRYRLHELANVFTGVMIAGGLLSQHLEAGSLRCYASNICEGSERGCALVRELRSQLLAACGEVTAASDGGSDESTQGSQEIS
jgi:nitrogen-specific signal transduction histidine kinase